MTEADVRAATPALGPWLDAHPEHRPLLQRVLDLGSGATFPKYLAGAGDDVLATFFAGLAGCDWSWIGRHRRALQDGPAAGLSPRDLEPVRPGRLDRELADFREEGTRALEDGAVGVLIFAGGAATRFYSEADSHPRAREVIARFGAAPPKGLFPLTPVAGRSFLESFVAEVLETGIDTGRLPPVVLMASGVTGDPIRSWLAGADLRGFPKDAAVVMGQAEHPRLDDEGDLVVQPDGRLIVTGDGHGGVYRALLAPGEDGGPSIADRLRAQGVRTLVLHNVDNAASRPLEPARLGFHARARYRFTMTVVPRARISEKVGLVARNTRTGRIEVVEYSVCPRELAEAAGPDGTPVFRLAHINTNLVELDAVRGDLPPTLYTGKVVQVGDRKVPTSSHEMLNQHLSGLLDARDVGVLLVDRDAYFLPTKSLAGEDSLVGTTAALSRAARGRLRAAGADVADDAIVELDPCLGLRDHAVVRAGGAEGWKVGPGATVYLGVREGLDGAPPLSPGLEVGAGATLRVQVDRPYGRVAWEAASRRITADPDTAGRVRIGRDVTIAPGAVVDLRVEGDGSIEVADGARLAGRVEAVAGPGQHRRVPG